MRRPRRPAAWPRAGPAQGPPARGDTAQWGAVLLGV